jgi:hypothetical protein
MRFLRHVLGTASNQGKEADKALLSPGTYVPLLLPSGETGGFLLQHSPELRIQLLRFLDDNAGRTNWGSGGQIAPYVVERIGQATAGVGSFLVGEGLFQIVASPQVPSGAAFTAWPTCRRHASIFSCICRT